MGTFGPYSMLLDFALASVLLLIAQYLRTRIKIIQDLFLPASLLAGFMGLFLSSQFLNWLPFSNSIGSYPYLLIVVLFATFFLGNKGGGQSFKQMIDKVGDTFALNMGVEFAQFGAALLVGGFIMFTFFPEVNHAFAILLPAGFVGGHGYAAAIGGTLKDIMGWDEAISIGQTFATIGLLTGVIGGVILINIATRIKATRLITSAANLPQSMRTGLIKQEERVSMGEETVSTMSIDPLCWHISLTLIAVAGGYYSTEYFKLIAPQINLPMMCMSMLSGVLLQFILNWLNLGQYVDKRVMTRIGSAATDYLVVFGVASIKISIVLKYAVPIVILSILCLIFCLLYLFVVGKKLFRNFWFERSIFIFGWATGVMAIGVALLRIADPEFRSKTLEDVGIAYVFISIFEIMIVSFAPIFVAKGLVYETGAVLFGIYLLLMLFAIKRYGIRKEKADELRPGEAEIIEQMHKDHQAKQNA